jgi:hypothetical protein
MPDQAVEITSTQAGYYYIMVYCASLYFGASDYTITAYDETTMPSLVKGQSVTGQLQSTNDVSYFQVLVGAGEHLVVTLDDGSAHDNNELYIRYGQLPTRDQYDSKFSLPDMPDQAVEITSTQAGYYYIMVYCASLYFGASDYTLTSSEGIAPPVIITTEPPVTSPGASVTTKPPVTTIPPTQPAQLPSKNTFIESVPLPDQVSTDPKVIGTNALLTSLLIVIIYFAASLFNGTLKENYETVHTWIQRIRTALRLKKTKTSSPSESTPKSNWPFEIVFIVLITAAINCAIVPDFGLNKNGLIIFTAMVATVIASTYSYNGIRVLITKYGFHIPATIRAYPLAILLAVIFVILSRLISFHPGLIFGFVGAFTILPSSIAPDRKKRSIGILWGVFIVILLALGAFFLRQPLASMTNSFWQMMLDTILVALFVGGLERLLFGLVPATFLDGGTLVSWKKLIWVIVFGLVVFLFVHIVINKSNALTGAVKDMNVITIVCLTLACLVFSLAFWGYFRFRSKREPNK